MGSFVMRPTLAFNSNLHWDALVGGVNEGPNDPADLLVAVTTPNVGPIQYALQKDPTQMTNAFVSLTCLGLSIYLDGNPTPIDTNNLPVGFTVTTCSVRAEVHIIPGAATADVVISRDGSPIVTVVDVDESVDFLLGPITNLALISTEFVINGNFSVGATLIQFSDLRIEGEYTSTGFTFTLTPPSGNVEPGQTVRVSGDNILGFTFGAKQGDKVIPIVPKIIDNDTVDLEIPKPPTDPCTVALAACPECEDCLTACENDLNSEACQACLDACLDCLEEELEDLEEAEECQQSQEDDPPVNIVIICGDPTGTQFNGSVTLGFFTIIVANASGIYRLVDGKTNDTQYETSRDGDTYDVKIPNPFGKTGFFRS